MAQSNSTNLPEKVVLKRENSITQFETRTVKATRQIKLESGFSAKGYFSAVVEQQNQAGLSQEPQTVDIYPNPFYDKITIRGFYENSTVTILDSSGNPIKKENLKGENPTLDLSTLTRGNYMLKFGSNVVRIIKK